jgi:ADP-ribose pyrophosphatase YjhB (NUDIX family)
MYHEYTMLDISKCTGGNSRRRKAQAAVPEPHQKVGVILWTIDPEGNVRFLLRHNKPFDGYDDEWTICFGSVEDGEDISNAAKREANEEYGVAAYETEQDLEYSISYEGKYGPTIIHFLALKASSIDIPITLNEESIGYDWMTLLQARQCMQHEDEYKALALCVNR